MIVSDELVEIGARAIMAKSGLRWESKVRHEALKHSRTVLTEVLPIALASAVPKPKERSTDRHRPGYYAEYRAKVRSKLALNRGET